MSVVNEFKSGDVTARVWQRPDGHRPRLTVEISPDEVVAEQLPNLLAAAKEAELYINYLEQIARTQCPGCGDTPVY